MGGCGITAVATSNYADVRPQIRRRRCLQAMELPSRRVSADGDGKHSKGNVCATAWADDSCSIETRAAKGLLLEQLANQMPVMTVYLS